MKKIFLKYNRKGVFALVLSMITGAVSAQEEISLQRAIELTLQNNLSIKQSIMAESLSKATLQQSKNSRLPSLSSTVQTTENFGRALDVTTYQYTSNKAVFAFNPSINANMPLFAGGQLRNQIIQNRLLVDADQSATAKLKNDLVLSVVVEYLQILTNTDLVTAAMQQVKICNINFDRSQKLLKAGNQTMADLSQAQANLSAAQLSLTNAQNQLDMSILILKQFMEIPAGINITIQKPDISQIINVQNIFNAQDIVNTALGINPDVKLAEAQQAVYYQAIKVVKGSFYPTLSLFSGLSSNYYSSNNRKIIGNVTENRTIGFLTGTPLQTVSTLYPVSITVPYTFLSQLSDNFSQAVGLSLQIPIFNRFNAQINLRKAKINYDNAAISTQIVRNNLTKTIFQAVLDAKASEKQYLSTQQTYQANKDAFTIVELRYREGLVNQLDYNTSLTNLNKSQNDMIQARYQMIFRNKIIDYYLGIPIKL